MQPGALPVVAVRQIAVLGSLHQQGVDSQFALTQTGKIAITNTMGLGERAVVASEAAELEEMQSGKKEKVLVPDYTLYAKLIQQSDKGKNVTQNTYSFQMSLVQTKTGLTVWEEEKSIAKQTRRAGSVGW